MVSDDMHAYDGGQFSAADLVEMRGVHAAAMHRIVARCDGCPRRRAESVSAMAHCPILSTIIP